MAQTPLRVFETASVSDRYARGRPTYDDKIVQHIVGSIRSELKGEKHELMVEVGCGSGQATNVLAPYFHNVHATDISESQIVQAKALSKVDHVNYQVGSAEKISAKDASADLLIAAESVHFYDLENFFSEVRRVLKPGGCLVLIGYVHPNVTPTTSNGAQRQLTASLSNAVEKTIIDNLGRTLVPLYYEIQNGYPKIFEAIPAKQKSKEYFHLIYDTWKLKNVWDFIDSAILLKCPEETFPIESERKRTKVLDTFVRNWNEILENNEISPESVTSYEADYKMTVITASNFK